MSNLHLLKHSALGFAVLVLSSAVHAHHGFGQFNVEVDTEYSGTLTRMELVNPHSYMHFETTDASGETIEMRCEMRAAMLIRRSGWDEDMFVVGAHLEIKGHPHRTDPTACYLESFTLNEETTLGRNDQLSSMTPVAPPADRPLRLATGEPNISGDWAVEQNVLTAPPSGGRGDMVPRSLRDEYASGQMTLAEIRGLNPTPRPVYTPVGQEAADKFEMWSVTDNPRLACQLTSLIFDWTFDWPINQITQTTTPQGERVVDMDFGLYNFNRRIHLDAEHPASLEPSAFGHSVGRWEGDTLVVDTVGFTAGVLAPPTRHSEQLHLVERFTLNPETMALRREYSATDPIYLAGPYAGADTVYLSETPYVYEGCKEMTPEFQPQ